MIAKNTAPTATMRTPSPKLTGAVPSTACKGGRYVTANYAAVTIPTQAQIIGVPFTAAHVTDVP